MSFQVNMWPFRSTYASLFLIGLLSITGLGQSSSDPIDPKRGAVPGASFSISDIETINLTNGNVMLNFPLVNTSKWRGGMSVTSGLTYNSKLFKPLVQEAPDLSNQMALQNFLEPNYEGGWRGVGSVGYSITSTNRGSYFECSNEVGSLNYQKNAYAFKVQIVFPDGSKKDFRPYGRTDLFGDGFFNVDLNGNEHSVSWATLGGEPGCSSTTTPPSNSDPMVYYSADGSYIRLEVERGTGYDNAFRLYFPDGSSYESSTRRHTDRHGNFVETGQISFNGSTVWAFMDGAGRKVLSTNGSQANEAYFYQEGVNGELIRWEVRSKTIYVRGDYTTTGANQGMTRGGTSRACVKSCGIRV